MYSVNRNSNLKIPKQIEDEEEYINKIGDIVETKEAIATANDLKFDKEEIKEKLFLDKKLKQIDKVPYNSNEIIVITVVKKLCAYIITITEKSPKKFRGVFVNRMQNYCIDIIEYLLQANFIRLDSVINKEKRENYQKEAIIKLKMLGYISMLAENSGCILSRQHKQISIQIAEAINLISAWKKSDDTRFKKRN